MNEKGWWGGGEEGGGVGCPIKREVLTFDILKQQAVNEKSSMGKMGVLKGVQLIEILGKAARVLRY